MGINEVVVEGFRGLKVNVKLKRVNIVLGENGSGKTSFLESIFIPTLLQSELNNNDIRTLLLYTLSARGDVLSAIQTLSDSEVLIDGVTTKFKKIDPYTINIEINNIKVAEIKAKPWSPLTLAVLKTNNKYSLPLYISTSFDSSDNPKMIYDVVKRKIRGESTFDLLLDEHGRLTLYYDKLPVYVIGRGLLKRELIRLALMSSDILLIDEIESSLHQDLLTEVLNDIKREQGSQVIFTTNSNEVMKIIGKTFNDSEAQIIYLSKAGYKTYNLSEITNFEKPFNWLGYV